MDVLINFMPLMREFYHNEYDVYQIFILYILNILQCYLSIILQ